MFIRRLGWCVGTSARHGLIDCAYLFVCVCVCVWVLSMRACHDDEDVCARTHTRAKERAPWSVVRGARVCVLSVCYSSYKRRIWMTFTHSPRRRRRERNHLHILQF
jgi:hypothetical protein